ncbi:MAG: outer membrane beta-barrel protein, partial [Chitinophagaceae bacterium]
KPDSARLSRLFHNIYGIINVTDKFGVTAGFDIGTEEKFPGSGAKNTWYSPVLILKYAFTNKWAIAGRLEHYNDKNGVIIATGSPNEFQTTGYSINIDNSPVKNVLVRLEVRNLSSKDDIFVKPSSRTNNNTFITSSIAVSF